MRVKGGSPSTCYGLAGIGDLIVTGISNLSRNFTFGQQIAQGGSIQDVKAAIGMVIEGEYTVLSAYRIAQEQGLHLPIVDTMYAILYQGREPHEAFHEMLDARSSYAQV